MSNTLERKNTEVIFRTDKEKWCCNDNILV
jgi:hypothetical protein